MFVLFFLLDIQLRKIRNSLKYVIDFKWPMKRLGTE